MERTGFRCHPNPNPRIGSLKGTQYTMAKAKEHARRYLLLDLQDPDRQRKAMAWLESLGAIHVLNIAGPRESEAPGIYEEARIFLKQILPSRIVVPRREVSRTD